MEEDNVERGLESLCMVFIVIEETTEKALEW